MSKVMNAATNLLGEDPAMSRAKADVGWREGMPLPPVECVKAARRQIDVEADGKAIQDSKSKAKEACAAQEAEAFIRGARPEPAIWKALLDGFKVSKGDLEDLRTAQSDHDKLAALEVKYSNQSASNKYYALRYQNGPGVRPADDIWEEGGPRALREILESYSARRNRLYQERIRVCRKVVPTVKSVYESWLKNARRVAAEIERGEQSYFARFMARFRPSPILSEAQTAIKQIGLRLKDLERQASFAVPPKHALRDIVEL